MGDGVTGAFARATAVSRTGDGRYVAEVAEGWDIRDNANGGYLLAIGARAMCDATDRPDPVTVTGHFLSPGRMGPIDVGTSVVKAGKRFTTARADLTDGATGRPVLAMLGTFGDLDTAEGPEVIDGGPPELPDPDECIAVVPGDPLPPRFMSKVELRLHPDDSGFFEGRPTGIPLIRGWFRLREGEPVDPIGLLCVVDSFPPTVFNARLPVAWTPTIELTAHVRARPAAGWLACEFRTRFVSGGFLEVDTEVWDLDGRFVAQARQLALVPRAPAD